MGLACRDAAELAGWADGRCGPEHVGEQVWRAARTCCPQSPPGLQICVRTALPRRLQGWTLPQEQACLWNGRGSSCPSGEESGVETGRTSCAQEDLSPALRCVGPEGTFQPAVEWRAGGGVKRS